MLTLNQQNTHSLSNNSDHELAVYSQHMHGHAIWLAIYKSLHILTLQLHVLDSLTFTKSSDMKNKNSQGARPIRSSSYLTAYSYIIIHVTKNFDIS